VSDTPSSWKAIIDQRRKQNFVGREDEQRLFSDNFVGGTPAYMLFAVTGEGGVGKSTLLKQYKSMVTSSGIGGITIRCDEHQTHPVAAMSHIAEKLTERGITHKDFEEWLKKYRDLQSKLGRDEKAPRSGVKVMSMGLSHFVLKTAKEIQD
jgi:KaiC/GvpD/RAD55 family RecA-like ATPase